MMKFYFLISFCLIAGCSHKKEISHQEPSYPIQVGIAEQKETAIFIDALGHVDSITSIQIRSRIEGELTGIFFEQGKEVKSGDLLFTIDSKPYEAILKSAQGTLNENIANRILAEEKVKRYKILTKDEYYSQIDYETLQANLAAASALVQQAEGEVDRALINLNYCRIYAPIDGMTGILQIDYGNLIQVHNSEPLTTLNQMAPIYVTFSIPEFQLPAIQKAYQKKELKTLASYEDFEGEVFEGRLYMLDNQIDPNTGMIKLRAIFENKNRELWPGQFIKTRLILSTIPDAVIIPHTAIQLTSKGPIAFVVLDNNRVEQRALKLGQRENEGVIVLDGIKGNEQIVLEGQINLFSGALIHRVSP